MKLLMFLSFLGFTIEVAVPQKVDVSNDKITRLVKSQGYPIEGYSVTTSDGYILKVHRIPGSPKNQPRRGKTVVFLKHGLLGSSADWVVLGKGNALSYLLADAGYDVWLGNARGNTNSRRHSKRSPGSRKFWEFSWHEIGQIDLPAMIDFVLLNTGQKDLHYIGHSQGTTAFFVMASLRREMNAKIRTMHALAPVAFMSNVLSPLMQFIAPLAGVIDQLLSFMGIYEFFPSNHLMMKAGKKLCQNKSPFQELCLNILFLIGGYDSGKLNRSIITTILDTIPSGASTKQFVHYAQSIESGNFQQFNNDLFSNFAVYGKCRPPNYPLKKVTAPVYLHYSDNDRMAAVKDVKKLASKLGNVAESYRIPDARFNHLDFIYAYDAKNLLYNRILDIIKRK